MWKMFSIIYCLKLFSRFSDFKKLRKANDFIFRFINNCKREKEPPDPKHSVRIKGVDGSMETYSLSYLYPVELSLTYNYFPDTPADEDNSVPSRDCREV